MSAETILIGAVCVVLAILIVARAVRRLPRRPDPWDAEVTPEELATTGTPVCVNCLRPVDNPNQHYCPLCGNVTGEYTRYIPFVNIPFNYSIFGTLWRKLRLPQTPLAIKVGITVLFILMLLVIFGGFIVPW